jgi:predicted RNase H-like HicB family nuclease
MAYSLAKVLTQETLQIWVWEEDGAYIAKCLDIPGCISEGNTREEALVNIHDAIAGCLEVIREDVDKPNPPDSCQVEMIEYPLTDFIGAR